MKILFVLFIKRRLEQVFECVRYIYCKLVYPDIFVWGCGFLYVVVSAGSRLWYSLPDRGLNVLVACRITL